MTALLLRAACRFYLRHPWQLALAILGVSLGVAVYVGVDLANASAQRAFQLSTEVVRGQTTHRLLAVGGSLDETVYRELVTSGVVTRAAPVLEVGIRLGHAGGARHTLLGIDPIEEVGLRDYSSASLGSSGGAGQLLTEARGVLVPAALADRLGLEPPDSLSLWLDNRREDVRVVGILRAPAGSADGEPPLVADIATVQELANRLGYLDRIDLSLTDAQALDLAAAPPRGTTLIRAGREDAALDAMIEAFGTNLAAMGLLALAVGMFLIYSTVSFAIVQRRSTIGVLRCIGVDRNRLLMSFLLEAAALGVVGTLGGLLLGHWLASQLLGMVLRTIGDLYFNAAVAAAAPSGWIYVQGAALGMAATLIAALGPGLEAARESADQVLSRAALERRSRTRSHRAAWSAIPVLLVAFGLLAADSESLVLGFAAMALLLCAGAMLTPAITLSLVRVFERPAAWAWGFPGILAVRGVGASLSRTAVAAAALAVAVATVVGVGLMIDSFRGSLVAWLDTTLTADLYVSLGAGAEGMSLEPGQLAALRGIAGIEGLSLSRTLRMPSDFGELGLRAAAPGPNGWGLQVVSGGIAALEDERTSDAIAISEPLAYRLEIGVGQRLSLATPDGPRSFAVAAVFRDYNAGGSGVLMPLAAYRQYWRDTNLSGIGVHLVDDDDEPAVRSAIAALLPGAPDWSIRSSAAIQDISMRIFDRTFQITEVLRFLAGLIAFLGVLSAMLAIQLERSRELAILRALGFGPRGLAIQVLAQTGLLGLCAGLAALPLGAGLAAVLVHVINRRSFGWTMELGLAAEPLGMGVGLAVAAALLAGIYPAWRSARTGLEAALRDE